MTIAVFLFLSALIGYLFGAFPAGFLLVKATKKIDLREFGSGRTGGTNSFRAAGITVGILTSILDVLKAACAVWVVRWLFGETLPPNWAAISVGPCHNDVWLSITPAAISARATASRWASDVMLLMP